MRTPAPSLASRIRRHALVAEIGRQLAGRCRWTPGSPIAVGCSGGVDSCVLLAACTAIARRRSSRGAVTAVHVHHHLRADADVDAEHVAMLARELDVPHVRRDVHPVRRGRGLADDARGLRHAALLDAAREAGATHIALAHHADDRLETLLMHLGRGTGLRGLGSIPWSRPAARGSGVRIARPMLALTRQEIVACAREVGIAWRDDPGNADPSTARGMLRTQVIPALRMRWPSVALHASSASDGARAGLLAGHAWSRARTACAAPGRTLLRATGPDLACLLIDSWLRAHGVKATWSQVTRIARAAISSEREPRTYPAGCRCVLVRSRALSIGGSASAP
ncbi:MAG: tRNA lysidine(34) synthetase TilS [Phycisphaerales bacterium]|nr:tRNA lysidine(34) synthetase TilS [Phycisphaerales bacterium]